MADDPKGATAPEEKEDGKTFQMPKTVKIKNNGIRHRVIHPDHGYHTIEKGETASVPGPIAYRLLVLHDEFEAVDAPKKFLDVVAADRKANEETVAQRAKVLEEEAEEARKADEATARSRGVV